MKMIHAYQFGRNRLNNNICCFSCIFYNVGSSCLYLKEGGDNSHCVLGSLFHYFLVYFFHAIHTANIV